MLQRLGSPASQIAACRRHAPGLAAQDRYVTRRTIFDDGRDIGQCRQVQSVEERQQVLDYIVRNIPLNSRPGWEFPFLADAQVGPRRGRRPLVQDHLEPPKAAMWKCAHGEHENPIGATLTEDCVRLRHVLRERPLAAPVGQLLAILTLRPAHDMMDEQKRRREQRQYAGEGERRIAKGKVSEKQNQDHNKARETTQAHRRALGGGSGACACQLLVAESLWITVLQGTSHFVSAALQVLA